MVQNFLKCTLNPKPGRSPLALSIQRGLGLVDLGMEHKEPRATRSSEALETCKDFTNPKP